MEKLFISQEANKSLEFDFCGQNWNYEAAFKEQLFAFNQISLKSIGCKILTGVHSPVYTLGNSIKTAPYSTSDVPFVKTDRGGQVMYHGPGQLTIYPIFRLKDFFKGPREYSKWLFDTVIQYFLSSYGLELKCKHNGLWLNDKKVGFLGLRIKDGITYHGLSINYCADLNAFKAHSPCDIGGEDAGNLFGPKNQQVPSLEKEASKLTKALALKLTI